MPDENVSSKVTCRICGYSAQQLSEHVKGHGLSSREYRNLYPGSRLRVSQAKPHGLQVTCQICNYKASNLYKHLKEHEISPNQYNETYRGCPIFVGQVAPDKPHGSIGRTVSIETRRIMSEQRMGKKTKPHNPETIIRMQETWAKRKLDTEAYDAYRAEVSKKAREPQRMIALRNRIAKSIKEGKHNGKSKDTALEKRLQRFLDVRGLDYETQFILDTEIGAFTFDFYISSMNLLVETDGEYWHQKQMMINRDRIKETLARNKGYNLVRLSDRDWRPTHIYEPSDTQKSLSEALLAKRERELLLESGMASFEDTQEWLLMKAAKAAQPKKSNRGRVMTDEQKKNLSEKGRDLGLQMKRRR